MAPSYVQSRCLHNDIIIYEIVDVNVWLCPANTRGLYGFTVRKFSLDKIAGETSAQCAV